MRYALVVTLLCSALVCSRAPAAISVEEARLVAERYAAGATVGSVVESPYPGEPLDANAPHFPLTKPGEFDGWVAVDLDAGSVVACQLRYSAGAPPDAAALQPWGPLAIGPAEARTLAEGAAGAAFPSAPVRLRCRSWPRQAQLSFDRPSGSAGKLSVWTVDLVRGVLVGWVSERTDSPTTRTERMPTDSALAIVRAEATRRLGPDADSLSWRVTAQDASSVTVSGEGPRVGDPPRGGLTASCRAEVSLVDGSIFSYQQTPACPDAPITPHVGTEEAEAIAIRAIGREHARAATPALLEQRDGRVYWVVVVEVAPVTGRASAAGGPEHWFVPVDALSGEPFAVVGGAAKSQEEVRDAQGNVIGYRQTPMSPVTRRAIVQVCAGAAGCVALVVAAIWLLVWALRRHGSAPT